MEAVGCEHNHEVEQLSRSTGALKVNGNCGVQLKRDYDVQVESEKYIKFVSFES